MSNLSHYRMSLAIFSLGLLWVVSEVVGDGEKPAPLDSATNSIVHRIAKSGDEAENTSAAPYELAVSQSDYTGQDENSPDDAAEAPARPVSPFALDRAGDDGDVESAAAEPATAPEPEAQPARDVGVIYK